MHLKCKAWDGNLNSNQAPEGAKDPLAHTNRP